MKNKITYKKIANDICEQISQSKLKQGDTIPSFTQIINEYHVSRDTAVKAYRLLKERGIVNSLPGKAYFVTSTNINTQRRICIFFDELSLYKSLLYNSLTSSFQKNDIPFDIYFHHFNTTLFNNILLENRGNYTDFIIMPIFDNFSNTLISQMAEKHNVFILDQGLGYFSADLPMVCQDFKMDLYNALETLKPSIERFQKIVMQIDDAANDSEEFMTSLMKKSFRQFCSKNSIECKIVKDIKRISEKTIFIVHNDIKLTQLIKTCRDKGIKPGKDIGIISFNETPFKEVMHEGITTISTDFEQMGSTMSEMVLSGNTKKIMNPFKIVRRKSF